MSEAREELAMEFDARTGARAVRECPKYSSCSAPICPLDHEWHRRSYHPSDDICALQRDALAPDAVTAFADRGIGDTWERIKFTDHAMRKKHPDLANRLDRAAEYRRDPEAKEKLRARFQKKVLSTPERTPRTAGIESGGTKPSTEQLP